MIDLTPILRFNCVVVRACTIEVLTDLVKACEKEGIFWCGTNRASLHVIEAYARREQPGLMILPNDHSFIFINESFGNAYHQFDADALYNNDLNKTVVKATDILGMLEL